MSKFLAVDLNGWLDHVVHVSGETASLGFRSCLYRHDNTWLLGAQALAAARFLRTNAPLIDAADALAWAAGQGTCRSVERTALPAALWQFTGLHAPRSYDPPHLALLVPDDPFLGCPKVDRNTGKTNLETLHDAFEQSRPASMNRNRVEFIWRSVAALRAAMDQEQFEPYTGSVLVISINRRTNWTVLKLRPWKNAPYCIVRAAARDDCEQGECWVGQRMESVRRLLTSREPDQLDPLCRWTRLVEILATDRDTESLDDLGIDTHAIDHCTWPAPDGSWEVCSEALSLEFPIPTLPQALASRIERFTKGEEGPPVAIVLENPAATDTPSGFEKAVHKVAGGIPICRIAGAATALAGARLAEELGRDRDAPAWLDEVPGIEIAVRTPLENDGDQTAIEWMTVVPGSEAVPAGETYHSHCCKTRRVALSPGIEHIHLHLRRGQPGAWDERYSGASTGHTILPSDHIRTVEPLARVRPLSGNPRIEIMEHLPSGKSETLGGSGASVKWEEMSDTPPESLRSIPELYVFRSSTTGWTQLKPLLRQLVYIASQNDSVDVKLKDQLYKCLTRQWKGQTFPLGSDGEPPRSGFPNQDRVDRRLLKDANAILVSELKQLVEDGTTLKARQVNRFHLPLTWCFTGCPESVVEILLKSLRDPTGKVGQTLHMGNDFSAWSIYQGVGRSAKTEDSLRTIFDELLLEWEGGGAEQQDKFLLSSVSHPMARRVAVRHVLNECRRRFERVKKFLVRQLTNLLYGNYDLRPSNKPNPSLELRYVTMGFRGLCQVRYVNLDWFDPKDGETIEIHNMLCQASKLGRRFEQNLISKTAPYLLGEGIDPTMPGGF